MKPYYEQGGITIYCGDAREVLPGLEAECIITDPIWPDCEHIFPGVDAQSLLASALSSANADRVVIHLGCLSDPRFLQAVPVRWPFFRVCWLRYACPSYAGRALRTSDVAYVFGTAPKPAPGRMVLPGEVVGVRADAGFTRWNQAGQTRRGGLDASRMPHPTPRKMEHVRWLVKWFGGESVIDPFMGSGTAARACKDLGVRFTGIEIEERFCEVAVRRLSQEVLPLWA